MFSSNVKAVIVPPQFGDDNDKLICTSCFQTGYSDGRYIRTVVFASVADNTKCAGCRQYIGKFTVEAPLNEAEYHELAKKLRHLDPEDLINLIGLTLDNRGDVKQPDVIDCGEGHYEQASILHYTPAPAEDGHTYPQRAFEIVVMERNTANIPAHLLSI